RSALFSATNNKPYITCLTALTSSEVPPGFTARQVVGGGGGWEGWAVPTRLVHVVIEAADPERLGRVWADVFGWQALPGSASPAQDSGSGGGADSSDGSMMVRPSGWRYPDPGPLPLLLVPADGPRTGRNRLHFDLPTKSAAHYGDEVKRITGLGATPADI